MVDPRMVKAFEEFESLGEPSVRVAITTGEFKLFALKHEFAVEWCRRIDAAQVKSATFWARHAAYAAYAAATIAAISIIITILIQK
jgi:hypothetical protein